MLTADFDLSEAVKVWREEGLEEGLQKGLERGRKEVARSMLAKGFALDVIMECTGLDKKALLSLR